MTQANTPGAGRALTWTVTVVCIASVGMIDYLSGTELRVYPLYFGPITLAAWPGHRGRTALIAAACAATWMLANQAAGMRFSTGGFWIANALIHGTAFLVVGLLITELRAALAVAREVSRTDPLTRLRNSRAFYEDARPLLSLCRRTSRPVTLAYVDLDAFKAVNDRHGHEAGDELLRVVAQAIARSVRPSDLAARLGGDEFAVFLPELGAEQATTALERLRQAVGNATGASSEITASVGGVTFLAPPVDLDELVRRADRLMYGAKAEGRNRVSHEIVGPGPEPEVKRVLPSQN